MMTKTAVTRKVAVMLGNGYHTTEVQALLKELIASKVTAEIVSKTLAPVKGVDGTLIEPQQSMLTAASVLYDAVYVCGGAQGVDELLSDVSSTGFVREAFQHY
ncbi:DJ-1/PfpI family protein [Paenibacillus sp. YAF4_2]|uniref:DJ-1/PfpI family protein n=1 Tax=Paenibacillus sp. YAF4_2 TaxID=3233085 RepID=UPI003F9AC32B